MEETSGILGSIVSLPDAGGALKPLGERFQPDLVRGTGNYAVPIDLPRGPNNLRPSLSLRYSTGQGNGAFGMGWQLSGPFIIARRTDRGVPVYDDATDEFVLSGAETLVPLGNGRYRPRSDTAFWFIQKEAAGWTVRTKDGRRYVLGANPAARIPGLSEPFAWLLEEESDASGNTIHYSYDVDQSVAYLREVTWSRFAVRLEYEDRPDVLRGGRAGFEQTTRRRCRLIEKRSIGEAQPVTGRIHLNYVEAADTRLSLLGEIRLEGVDATGNTESYPALRFSYTSFDTSQPRYHRLHAAGAPPPSLATPGVALIDMNGDGLPDVLETATTGHRWWPNRGDGTFGSVATMPAVPAGMVIGAAGVSFADLDGDGAVDLFRADPRLGTAVRNTAQGAWSDRPVVYTQRGTLRLSASDTRLVDIDGDGVPDLLQSSPFGFLITYNMGEQGWSQPQAVSRLNDPDTFPTIDLAAKETMVGDMNGDGLMDLVFVASGRVEYWPSLGRGHWGPRVRMVNAPVLPQGYRPDRIYLADFDGDGTADLLYLDFDRLLYWLNQGGEGWSVQHEVPFIPPPNPDGFALTDFLGTGTAGLLWSYRPTTRDDDTGYRYFEPAGGAKPYLLETIDDGFGSITRISYTSTAALRLADEQAGNPWQSYLPFPVQVVSGIRRTDSATGRESVMLMRYFGGYYDGREREFRGFERVELEKPGDAHCATTIQESFFFQGAVPGPLAEEALSSEERARRRALSGSVTTVRTWELDPDGNRVLRQSAEVDWDARLEFSDGQQHVHFPRVVQSEARELAPGGAVRIESAAYQYDAFGNVIRKDRAGQFEGAADPPLTLSQTLGYVQNEPGWLVGLPSEVVTRDGNGRLLKHTLHYYDGAPFTGMPLGQVSKGIMRRTREMVLADWALPGGYTGEIDPSWGLTHEGEGWYRDAVSYDTDEHGNPTGQRDGIGITKSIAYDADGLFPVRLEDAEGLTAECTFDPRTAQPLELRYSDGRITRYVYSPLGRLRAQYDTASDGSLQLMQAYAVQFADFSASPPRPARVISVKPLQAGRLLEDFADPLDPTAIDEASVACDYYDSDGLLLQRLLRMGDDGAAQRWSVQQRRDYTVQLKPAADYTTEFADTPAFQSNPPPFAVRYFYDGLNQGIGVERPDGSRLSVRFLIDRIEKRDAGTGDADPPQVERYNAWGHLIAVEQPDGAGNTTITRYGRDELGRVTTITDASGRISATHTYGGPGAAIHISHADAGARTYWRDGRSGLRLRTDSLNRRLRFEYDGLNRMLRAIDETDAANPVTVRSLTYSGAQLQEATDGNIRVSYGYDAAGHATGTSIHFGLESLTIGREYAYNGQIQAVVYPDGSRADYSYSLPGLPQRIAGIVDSVAYDSSLSPVHIDFAGGPSLDYTFDDAFRRMHRATLRSGANVLRDLEAAYDLNGNISGFTDRMPGLTFARRFTYDGLQRLLRSEIHQNDIGGPVLRDDHYEYSPTGDLLRNDEALSGSMLYADAAHTGRLTEFQRAGAGAPDAVSYDGAGRISNMGGMTNLQYDIWDRLIQATATDGATIRFEYDYRGARARKIVTSAQGTTETRYAENLYESDPSGTRAQIYLNKLLVGSRITPAAGTGETHYILTDHLGSILCACNAAGVIRAQQMYSPFGIPLQPAGPHDRYIGLVHDGELGLSQFGARYYCPVIGRFITPDWFIIENPTRAFRVPQGHNLYSYAINNPLALRDPSGLWFGIDDLIVAVVGFVVGFIAGLIHGIATGQGAGDTLLNALEGALVGAAGAWLAYNTAGAALGLLGVSASSGVGLGIAVTAAVVGGLNGVISGALQIYDWSSWTGWLAFLSDSTWGLIGTTLGVLLHTVNVFYGSGAKYREDLSRRQNRHVYDGGFGFGNFAFTQGNVTSNLRGRSGDLNDHEALHTFQSRLFGPIFQVTYVAWLVVGGLLAIVIIGPIAAAAGEDYGETIMDVAYRDIPWETWAYHLNPSPGRGGALYWGE